MIYLNKKNGRFRNNFFKNRRNVFLRLKIMTRVGKLQYLPTSSYTWLKRKVKVTQLCLTLGLYSPWNSPGRNSGVGSCSLLRGIFPTQEWNPGPPYCWWILYQLRHKGSLYIWIALITEHDFIMKTTDCSISFYLTQSYFKDGSGWCSTFCWFPQRTNSQNKQNILK